MADQMNGAAGVGDDGFHGFGLLIDRAVTGGANFFRSAVAHEARRHRPETILENVDDRAPGSGLAERPRYEHEARSCAMLDVVDRTAVERQSHGSYLHWLRTTANTRSLGGFSSSRRWRAED